MPPSPDCHEPRIALACPQAAWRRGARTGAPLRRRPARDVWRMAAAVSTSWQPAR